MNLIGAFIIYRRKFVPSPTSRSSWSQNFAAQAVIAIENARLLNELRQRTTDLQRRWSSRRRRPRCCKSSASSPGDLAASIRNHAGEGGSHLCDATFGNIFRWDGDAFDASRCTTLPADLI